MRHGKGADAVGGRIPDDSRATRVGAEKSDEFVRLIGEKAAHESL
jgi:hypothetical protein